MKKSFILFPIFVLLFVFGLFSFPNKSDAFFGITISFGSGYNNYYNSDFSYSDNYLSDGYSYYGTYFNSNYGNLSRENRMTTSYNTVYSGSTLQGSRQSNSVNTSNRQNYNSQFREVCITRNCR